MPTKPKTLRIELKVVEWRDLDLRTGAGRSVQRWRRELLAQCGGAKATETQRMLIDMAARTRLYLDHYDTFIMMQPSVINKKRKTQIPLMAQREEMAMSLRATLAQLGRGIVMSDQPAEDVGTLADLIRSHDAAEANAVAEPGGAWRSGRKTKVVTTATEIAAPGAPGVDVGEIGHQDQVEVDADQQPEPGGNPPDADLHERSV